MPAQRRKGNRRSVGAFRVSSLKLSPMRLVICLAPMRNTHAVAELAQNRRGSGLTLGPACATRQSQAESDRAAHL